MQDLPLTLPTEATTLALEGLGNLPFAKVYALVAKIQAQATEQIKARGAGSASSGNPGEGSAAPGAWLARP